MSESPTDRAAGRSALLPLAVVAILLNAGGFVYFAVVAQKAQTGLATVAARSERLERAVDLLRLEATSQYEGYGFHALLDHLTYWAPQLQKSSTGTLEFYDVEKRVRSIVEIMGQLRDVYGRIEAAIVEGGIAAEDPATDDEIRKWLLRAAHLADPERGRDLYAKLLRAKDVDVSSRLRRVAVTELIAIDKKLTGEILHDILTTESARSIARPGAQGTPGKTRRQPQFYNFIDYYVATDHPGLEQTLQQLLNRAEHDLLTKQACVKALGDRKVRAAAGRLEQLYWEQHTPHAGHVPNPMFRLKILDAIVKILDADAVEFLKDVDRKESSEAIRKRLTELKKKYSF